MALFVDDDPPGGDPGGAQPGQGSSEPEPPDSPDLNDMPIPGAPDEAASSSQYDRQPVAELGDLLKAWEARTAVADDALSGRGDPLAQTAASKYDPSSNDPFLQNIYLAGIGGPQPADQLGAKMADLDSALTLGRLNYEAGATLRAYDPLLDGSPEDRLEANKQLQEIAGETALDKVEEAIVDHTLEFLGYASRFGGFEIEAAEKVIGYLFRSDDLK
jgi:hypothetical protein